MAICNILGRAMFVDETYKSNVYQFIVHILVEIDVNKRLFESIDVVVGDIVYSQTLGYVNVPFHYFSCHPYGQVPKDWE